MSGPRPAAEARSSPVSMIDALTGIRAPALIVVLTVHLREPMQTLLPWTAVADTYVRSGFLAVDTFFVLSGFVISHNYAHQFATFGRGVFRGYLVSRFARIYPSYLLAFAFTAVVVIVFALDPRQFSVAGFVTSLLLVQPLPGIEVWNGPSWSVGCEVVAYVLFPFAAASLLRLRRSVALVLAVLLVVLLVVAVDLMYAADGPFPFVAYFWVRLLVGFPLGCLVWAAWRGAGRGVRPHWRWDVVALAAAAGVLLVIHFEHQNPRSYVVVGLIAVFVAAAASATGIVRSVLSWRPVMWLGEVSLPVYLVHYPLYLILFAVLPAADYVDAPLPVRLGVVLAYYAVSLALGGAVHHLVEEPARRRIRRAYAARTASVPATAAPTTAASTTPAAPEQVS